MMRLIQENKNSLEEIITALKNGAVLVLPTDTVYGLVCDAKNEKAVEKIFEIKKRDKAKPLAVFVKDIEMAKEIAEIDARAEKFLGDNKTTIIVKAKNKKLSDLVYKDGTIGIRIPNYEFLNLILNEFDGPLAQTSVNISGQEPIIKIVDIKFQFANEDVSIVNAGDLPKAKPSKIIDLSKGGEDVLRY